MKEMLYTYIGEKDQRTSLINYHFNGKTAKGEKAFQNLLARMRKIDDGKFIGHTVVFRVHAPHHKGEITEIIL